jgi:hypothetical protein
MFFFFNFSGEQIKIRQLAAVAGNIEALANVACSNNGNIDSFSISHHVYEFVRKFVVRERYDELVKPFLAMNTWLDAHCKNARDLHRPECNIRLDVAILTLTNDQRIALPGVPAADVENNCVCVLCNSCNMAHIVVAIQPQ